MSDSETGRRFLDEDLSGALFDRCDLSRAVLRGVAAGGMEIDDPWLLRPGGDPLLVNGVDVTPYVREELERRFPGRALARAEDPAGLRAAYDAAISAWDDAVARAEAMPEGTLEERVAGEYSFSETVRHLVMATDIWLRRTVLGIEDAISPLAKPHAEYETDGFDMSVFSHPDPTWAEVLEVRADRVAQVRAVLADATPERLDATVEHPWGPGTQIPVRHCLHVIIGEEWEHLRFALRDLDVLAERS